MSELKACHALARVAQVLSKSLLYSPRTRSRVMNVSVSGLNVSMSGAGRASEQRWRDAGLPSQKMHMGQYLFLNPAISCAGPAGLFLEVLVFLSAHQGPRQTMAIMQCVSPACMYIY